MLFRRTWLGWYKSGVNVTQATVDVHISFNQEGSSSYALSAELHVHIPGVDWDVAQKLADAAHKGCPYSKATRGNIDVKVIAD